MAAIRKWYAISAKQEADGSQSVEIQIYDEIGFWGVTAKQFIADLDALTQDGAKIVVAINSPGGDVFDAFAIYNALRRYAGNVTTRVDGVAASAASLVLMAGDQIIMPENAMLMIHNPATIAYGEASEMRKAAEMLDKARDGILAAYRAKSGQSDEELIRMMDEETWLTALEAQALGFCDVIEAPVKLVASATAQALLGKFGRVPEALLNAIEEPETPAAPAVVAESVAEAVPAVPAPPAAQTVPAVPAAPTASALASHVFAACRNVGLSHHAEAIAARSGLNSLEVIDAAISSAQEIASLCVAAKLPELAGDFIRAGLDTEQVRARLYDRVLQNAAGNISNTQHDNSNPTAAKPGLSVSAIYASINKRKGAGR